MQLIAHNAHNLVKGQTFFSDHKYFSKLYETYTEDYDSVVEKCIGLGIAIDLQEVTQDAAMKAASVSTTDLMNPESGFSIILRMEKELQVAVEKTDSNASYGTKNFLQGLADLSENRCYQLQQRLK